MGLALLEILYIRSFNRYSGPGRQSINKQLNKYMCVCIEYIYVFIYMDDVYLIYTHICVKYRNMIWTQVAL